MDFNNQVVMNDSSALPQAEGDGGVAKVIHERMAINSSLGLTAKAHRMLRLCLMSHITTMNWRS